MVGHESLEKERLLCGLKLQGSWQINVNQSFCSNLNTSIVNSLGQRGPIRDPEHAGQTSSLQCSVRPPS